MKKFCLSVVFATPLLFSGTVSAVTVWTDWTSIIKGQPGSAEGSLGSTGVAYSGDVINVSTIDGNTTVWDPDATFIGGAVDVSPSTIGDVIGLNGATATSTISFSAPVLNPVIAIFSLGAPDDSVMLAFDDATPSLEVYGLNSTFTDDLADLVVSGNSVTGQGGSGVIMFEGLYSSLTFNNSNGEYWYGITVGNVTAVPVPAAVWLFGSGLLGLVGVARRR